MRKGISREDITSAILNNGKNRHEMLARVSEEKGGGILHTCGVVGAFPSEDSITLLTASGAKNIRFVAMLGFPCSKPQIF